MCSSPSSLSWKQRRTLSFSFKLNLLTTLSHQIVKISLFDPTPIFIPPFHGFLLVMRKTWTYTGSRRIFSRYPFVNSTPNICGTENWRMIILLLIKWLIITSLLIFNKISCAWSSYQLALLSHDRWIGYFVDVVLDFWWKIGITPI
jgi:hypothetical protein